MKIRDLIYVLFLINLVLYGITYGISNNPTFGKKVNDYSAEYNKLCPAGTESEACTKLIDSQMGEIGIVKFFIYLIAIFSGLLFSIINILMLIWMLYDLYKRKENLGKTSKVGWGLFLIILSLVAIPNYFISVKRKDWDPQGKQTKIMTIISIIAIILLFITALYGLFLF